MASAQGRFHGCDDPIAWNVANYIRWSHRNPGRVPSRLTMDQATINIWYTSNTIRVDGIPSDDGMVFSLTLPVRRDSYA